MSSMTDHDAYIAAAPEAFRPALTQLRALLNRSLPEAEEIVAYNMPGFTIGGSVVASYAAFSKQCGLYVLPAAITEHAGGDRGRRSEIDEDRHHLLAAQADSRRTRRTPGASVVKRSRRLMDSANTG